jgi:hypothetical protein
MRLASLLLLFLLYSLPLQAEVSEISAASWAQPRHGEWLLQQAGIASAMRAMQQAPDARLQLLYPGGDEGALWAEELQAWLVALGLPSSRIERIPGSASANVIQLRLQP